jgi:hypothetical protein
MWNNTKIELEIVETNPIKAVFEYAGDKKVKEVKKSCSCTSSTWIEPTKLQLTANTTLVKDVVPKRLYEQGKDFYEKVLTAEVVYEDNTSEMLKVEAKIIKGLKD